MPGVPSDALGAARHRPGATRHPSRRRAPVGRALAAPSWRAHAHAATATRGPLDCFTSSSRLDTARTQTRPSPVSRRGAELSTAHQCIKAVYR